MKKLLFVVLFFASMGGYAQTYTDIQLQQHQDSVLRGNSANTVTHPQGRDLLKRIVDSKLNAIAYNRVTNYGNRTLLDEIITFSGVKVKFGNSAEIGPLSGSDTLTAPDANPLNFRIDLLVVNRNGTTEIITGTPGEQGIDPPYDVANQIPVYRVLVNDRGIGSVTPVTYATLSEVRAGILDNVAMSPSTFVTVTQEMIDEALAGIIAGGGGSYSPSLGINSDSLTAGKIMVDLSSYTRTFPYVSGTPFNKTNEVRLGYTDGGSQVGFNSSLYNNGSGTEIQSAVMSTYRTRGAYTSGGAVVGINTRNNIGLGATYRSRAFMQVSGEETDSPSTMWLYSDTLILEGPSTLKGFVGSRYFPPVSDFAFVQKHYVDSVATGGGGADPTKLPLAGGTMTGSILTPNDFKLQRNQASNVAFLNYSGTSFWLASYDSTSAFSTNGQEVYADDGLIAIQAWKPHPTNPTTGGHSVQFNLDPAGHTIYVGEGTTNPAHSPVGLFKGITYTADYSANYTSRSLIDKGYADAHYSGGGSGGDADSLGGVPASGYVLDADVDAIPTNGSTDPVSSDGTYDALVGKANISHTHVESDVTGLVSDLAGKEDASNKSTSTSLGTSNTLYPSQNAVKVYTDAKVADAISDGTTTIAPSQNAVYDALALKADKDSPTTLTYAATTNLDFVDPVQTLTLTGNVLFTTASLANGKSKVVRIIGDASLRTLGFPLGWKWLGDGAPSSLAAGKVAILSLYAFGTSDTDVIAAFSSQP